MNEAAPAGTQEKKPYSGGGGGGWGGARGRASFEARPCGLARPRDSLPDAAAAAAGHAGGAAAEALFELANNPALSAVHAKQLAASAFSAGVEMSGVSLCHCM